jgi:hypothetical protein
MLIRLLEADLSKEVTREALTGLRDLHLVLDLHQIVRIEECAVAKESIGHGFRMRTFGLSRPVFYVTQELFQRQGRRAS